MTPARSPADDARPSPGAAIGPGGRALLQRELDDALRARMLPAYVTIPTLVLLFVGLGPMGREHPWQSLAVIGCALAVLAGRLFLHVKARDLATTRPKVWRRWFVVLTLAGISAWEVLVCGSIARYGLDQTTLLMIVCTAALNAAATNTLAPHLALQRASLLTLSLPVIVMAATRQTTLGLEVTAVTTLDLAFHLFQGARIHRALVEALENLALLDERNQALAQLAALRKELEHADRLTSLGTLAGGVGHEINNPLTMVVAGLEFLAEDLDRLAAELPPGRLDDVRAALDDARHGADRVSRIVADLKALSRADDRPPGAIDVGSVLARALAVTGNQLRHRATVVEDLAPVPQVIATEAKLEQVFIALLVNAAQAIPEGSADRHRVVVSTRIADDGRVAIEIRDTGVGIPEELRPRFFEPFFTTRSVGDGVGLGLSICHGVLLTLGGELTFDSAVGAGSTFRVLLPAAPAPGASTSAPGRPAEPASRRRVLIVDDEPLVGRSLQRMLGSGHDVDCVGTASEALARLERGDDYDLILCDLMMPRVSGIDFYRALRASARGADHLDRLVYMTGGAFTPAARAFLAEISNRCISKPIKPEVLRTLVRSTRAAPRRPAGPARARAQATGP